MTGYIFLADSASSNGDGTISLLRGRFSRVFITPGPTAGFKGAVVVFVDGEVGDVARKEKCSLFVRKVGREKSEPDMAFEIPAPAEGLSGNLIIDIQVPISELGKYEIGVNMGSKTFSTFLHAELKIEEEKKEAKDGD